jgi:hypothetical protein
MSDTASPPDDLADRRFEDETQKLIDAHRELTTAIEAASDADEVVAALRQFRDKSETVPESVRAIHRSRDIAERLVELLESAGVSFAGEDPTTQVAAGIYAGWSDCYRGTRDAVDWLEVVSLTVDGVEHSLEHATGAPETALAAVQGRDAT